MKEKLIIIPFALAIIGMSSCSSGDGANLNTKNDSLSYSIGFIMGENVAQLKEQYHLDSIDMEIVKNAMLDALDSTRTFALDIQQSQEFMASFLSGKQEKLRSEQLKQYEGNKSKGEEFLVKNKSNSGVVVTPSGLQYLVKQKGNGTSKPSIDSEVEVKYTLSDINGVVIESTEQSGKNARFPLNRVIPGWTEGIQLMSEGDIYMLYVPQDLAYGDRGQADIPPYSTLVFQVELVKIFDKNEK
jgi:FKBP-type peptidyl-prolyl cis-trans isomerase FklB